MLYSFSKNLLFVHIPKTAGSSVHNFIRTNGGQDDCVTIGIHSAASKGLKLLGEKRWGEILKFAVVRHPADLMLSRYAFQNLVIRYENNANGLKPSPAEWLRSEAGPTGEIPYNQTPHKPYLQSSFLDADVDVIVRYENLVTGLESVFSQVGWDGLEFPHKNATKHEPWQKVWTEDDLRIIEERYSVDYERFGYAKS